MSEKRSSWPEEIAKDTRITHTAWMAKRQTKAQRMASEPEDPLDEDAILEDFDRLFDETMRSERVRIMQELNQHPVGYVVDNGGLQSCVIARGDVPDGGRRDDADRRDLGVRLNKPMILIGPQTEHEIHEWMDYVHGESPWMADVSTYVMRQVEQRFRQGDRFVHFEPVLVHGAPGVGKSHYANFLAESAGVPVLTLDGSSMISVFQISGVERGWHGACASPVVRFLAEKACANPVVIIDEVDKVGTTGNARGGSPHSALLGMIERLSAQQWRCPYTELVIDLSKVSWFFTANDISGVPQPLIDRCKVIRAGSPTPRQMMDLVRAKMPDEDPAVVQRTAEAAVGMSLRRVQRMIDAVVSAGNGPMLN